MWTRALTLSSVPTNWHAVCRFLILLPSSLGERLFVLEINYVPVSGYRNRRHRTTAVWPASGAAQASATVEADYGNADSVVQALSDEKIQKRLFVVGFDSPADAVVLVKLAKAFRNWPILALVGGSQQAENLILANRSGAVQVVAAPIQSLDLRSALNSIAISYRPAEQDCRVVAFTGSVAGCGTTTIATNAAYEIATLRQRQTVLIELASQMGVVAINLGIETPCTLEGILADEEHLDAELVKSSLVSISDHLRILAASGNMVHGGGSITVDGAARTGLRPCHCQRRRLGRALYLR